MSLLTVCAVKSPQVASSDHYFSLRVRRDKKLYPSNPQSGSAFEVKFDSSGVSVEMIIRFSLERSNFKPILSCLNGMCSDCYI